MGGVKAEVEFRAMWPREKGVWRPGRMMVSLKMSSMVAVDDEARDLSKRARWAR